MARPDIDVDLKYRVPLGRKLTNLEVDQNFRLLANASNTLADAIEAGSGGTDPTNAINQAIQNHVDSADPHTQYIKDAPLNGKPYNRMDGDWVEAGAGSGGNPEFVNRTYTNVATSGTKTEEEVTVNVNPPGNSTAVVLGARFTTMCETTHNLTTGSSVGAIQSVVSVGGTGFIDKVVGILSHINFGGTGRKQSALCFEAGFPAIPADSDIGSVCGFYFPNLEGIPNINRIGVIAAFANQHKKALIQNAGVYVDGLLRQFAPPYHPGLVPGRYYTSPYFWLGFGINTQPGTAYLTLVHVPMRTVITKLGMLTNSAGSGRKVRLGMFVAYQGGVGPMQGQTAELNADANGIVEGTVNFEVDPGMYWLAINTSVAMAIGSHNVNGEDGMMGSLFGQSDPTIKEGNTQRSAAINMGSFGPFPANPNIVPTFLTANAQPHIWFRFGV